MALKPVFLLLLWGLTVFHHGVASFCSITCSTDYSTSLNCSCSGSVPTLPVLLTVTCRDAAGELEVSGSCEIKPPRSGCSMVLETLDEVASVGTICNTTASQQGDRGGMHATESSSWALSDVVKPLPPSNVQVANADEFYNITWNDNDNNNQEDCFIYRVRIRQSRSLFKDPTHSLEVTGKYILLDRKKLQPHINYTVDVQAKMCPEHYYKGPWSEWSSAAEWRTSAASAEVEGISRLWWCISVPIVLILCLLLLGYLHKPYCQKKLDMITFVPKPNKFFESLYIDSGGNFKEWVKPGFSESDYLKVSPSAPMMSEKPYDVLHWNNEKQGYSEDSETRPGGHFFLQPPGNLLLHLQDGGSSQGTGHSAGHISIHTVTLSGEEFEEEEEVSSQSSINTLRSYQDGEGFGSFEEEQDNGEHASYDLEEPQMSRMDRPPHEILLVENINFEPHFNDAERVSLDSFVSNEQSEDGYPHVDLDTIDSGFGECSSPGASDPITAERMDSADLFHEHKNSNYVKQWMICSTIQEDSNELHEAQ